MQLKEEGISGGKQRGRHSHSGVGPSINMQRRVCGAERVALRASGFNQNSKKKVRFRGGKKEYPRSGGGKKRLQYTIVEIPPSNYVRGEALIRREAVWRGGRGETAFPSHLPLCRRSEEAFMRSKARHHLHSVSFSFCKKY